MQSLDLGLIARNTILSIVFCAPWIYSAVHYKKINTTRLQTFLLIVLCGVITEVTKVLHEVGHVLAAKCFGLRIIKLGISRKGYNVLIDPPIYNASPTAQTCIALAGPAVSMLIVAFLLIALRYLRNNPIKVMSIYMLFVCGFGGVLSLLLPLSGDARNFFQGLAKLMEVNIERLYFLDAMLLSATLMFFGVKIYREIKKL